MISHLYAQQFGENMKAFIVSFLLGFCSLAISNTLSLDELSLAITEHNKRGQNRITSLEALNTFHSFIPGTLSADEYKEQYNLTNAELTQEIFGNIYHLTLEDLPKAIVKWNIGKVDPRLSESRINSLKKYDTFGQHIQGALAVKTYLALHGINKKELTKMLFGNSKYFVTLEELPEAIDQYNNPLRINKIVSFDTLSQYYHLIERALSPETYRILHDIDKTEFIKYVFSRVTHLHPDELPHSIEEYHNRLRSNKILSFANYSRHRSHIKGALSFDTYNILYGITREQFEALINSVVLNRNYTDSEIKEYEQTQAELELGSHSHTTRHSQQETILTLEQTPQAIEGYNKLSINNKLAYPPINSWASYKKHSYLIPGADAIANLEKQYKDKHGTLHGFLEFLLGKPKKILTPQELSQAIAKYNSEMNVLEQIDEYIQNYEIFYYRVLHAPSLEEFKQYAKDHWNELFQKKFGTVDKYVEFIILVNSCEMTMKRLS